MHRAAALPFQFAAALFGLLVETGRAVVDEGDWRQTCLALAVEHHARAGDMLAAAATWSRLDDDDKSELRSLMAHLVEGDPHETIS
jgi:hypothetical protein